MFTLVLIKMRLSCTVLSVIADAVMQTETEDFLHQIYSTGRQTETF